MFGPLADTSSSEAIWDYPVERRGVLFAPVYFESGVYSRRGYYYSPTIVIDLGVFTDHLFLRPRYHHYYFGDYYAASYHQGGFYASFSFQSSRYGYDPIYSHQRWEHRQDREWEHRVEASYQYRRDHETARPPRTWAAQRNINPRTAESEQNRLVVATSFDQLAKRKDSPMRFQPVAKAERQQLAQRGQEVQKSRDQRRTLEAQAVDTTARKPGGVFEPAKVTLPRSPIVAKPANQLGRNQAPPKAQPAPKPDLKLQPKSETSGRQPNVDRSNPQPESRQPEAETKSAPGRSEAAPRDTKAQPESQPRANQRPPASTSVTTVQPPVRNEAQPAGKKAVAAPAPTQVQKPAVATHESAAPIPKNSKTQSETRKSVPAGAESGPAAKSEARPEGNQPPAIKEPTRQNANQQPVNVEKSAQPSDKKAQRVSEQPARKRPDTSEKGATKLLKRDTGKKGEE